jgi:hypothetical protein
MPSSIPSGGKPEIPNLITGNTLASASFIDMLPCIEIVIAQLGRSRGTANRLIDFEGITQLARLLDCFAGEAHEIATTLWQYDELRAAGLRAAESHARESAAMVLARAAAAEPAPFWSSDRSFVGDRQVGHELDALVAVHRAAVWGEIRQVVGELNRLSAMGVRSGRYREGLLADYKTLVSLSGRRLVYFAVDRTISIGTRSGRAGYRAGIWIGPADAEHILVMIPGMNTNTAGWLSDNVPDAGRLQHEAATLADRHGRGGVAVVPLLSYSPPQSFLDATLGRFWREGSAETAAVLESLPLDGRHVVGWAHSYGAAVLGATASISSPFDDLIMAGGAGTGTETLEELGVSSDHLYVATNWNDPIRLVPNDYHGVNPATLPHMEVPTAPATGFEAWKAVLSVPWFLIDGLPDHDYLADETATRAFAAIAIGLSDLTD